MISYKDIALQILSYSSQADYNCYRVIVHFVPNFAGMATGVAQEKMQFLVFAREKMRLAAFDGAYRGVFGDEPSNAASRIFLRPTPVELATKFGTKLAITR